MKTAIKKITREQYERAKANHGRITREDENTVFTDAERWGYGVYGSTVYAKDGEYFVSYSLGDTCD